jgi:hypothetical protein
MDRMNYEECVEALKFTKQFTPEERVVAAIKESEVQEFSTLLKYIIDADRTGTIDNKTLVDAWLFYKEIKQIHYFRENNALMSSLVRLRDTLSEAIGILLEAGITFDASLSEVTKNTPAYQILCEFDIVHKRLTNALRFSTHFESSDPIEWYKRNGYSLNTQSSLDTEASRMWRYLFLVSQVDLDPIKQR